MNLPIDSIEQELDHLYRQQYGKLLAWLLHFSSSIRLESAEDIVQDAFGAALANWKKEGVPDNPAGWIFTVCRNKALNEIRKSRNLGQLPETLFEEQPLPEYSQSVLDDQQLKLLFACAHPDLSPKVQVVITLKYVLNLKVDAIAAVLGMSIDGIDKMLVRSRQKIREQNIIFSLPAISSLKSRLPIVHKIIYLIFNEGYKSVSGKELVREELCEEALLMNKEILDKRLGDPSTAALQALMLFNAARLKARFGPNGDLRDLEEQDRSLWNKELIFLGTTFFKQSRTTILSTYHFEASIAYLHCNGKDFHSTDWMSISRLYNHLVAINPNPFVELNAAIALYYAGNCKEALARLYELAENSLMQKYYLLNATLGKIHYLEGNHTKAREYFLRTIEQTKIQSEKDFIMKMLAKLEQDR